MTADRDESPATREAVSDHYAELDSPDAGKVDSSSWAATDETRPTDAPLRLVVDSLGDDVQYSMKRLAIAFDRVRGNRDWKAPIRAEIAAEDRAVVEQAVIWFTATVPTFDPVPGAADRLSVTAAGYRRGPWGVTDRVALCTGSARPTASQ